MRRFLFYLVFFLPYRVVAQVPVNDSCQGAILISDAREYCSADAEFSNAGATESFIGNGKDVWFKFTPRNFEVKITVTGGTIVTPDIKLYEASGDCIGFQRIAPVIKDGQVTILSNAGLNPNKTYFISVSGGATREGTFKLCIQTFQSQIKPGQDYATATLLCNTQDIIREVNVVGAGADQNELAGACFDEEMHSAWYKWTAANNGTLVFTLTPSKHDDLDWVLFELGPEGQEQKPSANNIIRCAAGHGINNDDCPNEPIYTQTGLDFDEDDISEAGGCGKGQNGMLKEVAMKEGYVYALIVNNFSNGNNGFELSFTDRNGRAGSGLFKGPEAVMTKQANALCQAAQSYTFSATAKNYSSLKWYFGEDADIQEADKAGPFTIRYSKPGLKTVVLQVTNNIGCTVVYTETFEVGLAPEPAVISGNKNTYCISQTLELRAETAEEGVEFFWTGPNNFTSNTQNISIPITGKSLAGRYSVILKRNGCSSLPATIDIPPILDMPVAAFSSDPELPAKLAYPISVKFINQSSASNSWLWDFGDSTTSTERDPVHIYTAPGSYTVSLTAFNADACEASVSRGTFLISALNAIFIPNTFTPNNDLVNDEFVVSINNVRTYRLQIYNRYGTELFSSANPIQNWDGTYKERPVPAGTYYYVLDAVDFNGYNIRRSGSVTILR